MHQRKTIDMPSLRTCLRSLTLFLYVCLAGSLTWYEASFCLSASITPAQTAVLGHLGDSDSSAVKQGSASRRLPSLLTSAPKLQSATRLRPENRDDDLPPIRLCRAVASEALCLPSLRTDPVAWDRGTPPFLLPSAYGLVPFAIPRPFRLA